MHSDWNNRPHLVIHHFNIVYGHQYVVHIIIFLLKSTIVNITYELLPHSTNYSKHILKSSILLQSMSLNPIRTGEGRIPPPPLGLSSITQKRYKILKRNVLTLILQFDSHFESFVKNYFNQMLPWQPFLFSVSHHCLG